MGATLLALACLQGAAGHVARHSVVARSRVPFVRVGAVSVGPPPAAAPRALVHLAADADAVAPLLETTQRSVVKALSWRATAGVVTLCTSLFFSGSLRAALGIVGADFATKSITMFVGERLWNKSNVGRGSSGDTMGRSLLKALVWRVFAATNTLISAGLLAGQWDAAFKIAGSDTLIKTTLFFAFERAWDMVSWGRYTGSAQAPNAEGSSKTA
ncbi:hypothetical protein KFE25_004227 [Diacronema lutheri]|uniref:DUF2061 domain-containing protein n=2 Tax=Diacronema lutheri TaxID=2081491 RepID=A0A8J5X900_DIALT|nr:hypothetical protein KFE25_004227 [Diacronema lutheri]